LDPPFVFWTRAQDKSCLANLNSSVSSREGDQVNLFKFQIRHDARVDDRVSMYGSLLCNRDSRERPRGNEKDEEREREETERASTFFSWVSRFLSLSLSLFSFAIRNERSRTRNKTGPGADRFMRAEKSRRSPVNFHWAHFNESQGLWSDTKGCLSCVSHLETRESRRLSLKRQLRLLSRLAPFLCSRVLNYDEKLRDTFGGQKVEKCDF